MRVRSGSRPMRHRRAACTGGQGASISPFAISRRDISSNGSNDCGRALYSAHGSPRSATRAGTVAMVSSSGTIVISSSQKIGVDTCAPTRGRTHHAPNTVLCGAF